MGSLSSFKNHPKKIFEREQIFFSVLINRSTESGTERGGDFHQIPSWISAKQITSKQENQPNLVWLLGSSSLSFPLSPLYLSPRRCSRKALSAAYRRYGGPSVSSQNTVFQKEIKIGLSHTYQGPKKEFCKGGGGLIFCTDPFLGFPNTLYRTCTS